MLRDLAFNGSPAPSSCQRGACCSCRSPGRPCCQPALPCAYPPWRRTGFARDSEHMQLMPQQLHHFDRGRHRRAKDARRRKLRVLDVLRTNAKDHFLARVVACTCPSVIRHLQPGSRRCRRTACLPHRPAWPSKKFMLGLPMKPATKMLFGTLYRLRGESTCCKMPSLSTAMRSPIVIASTWSWVT